MLGFIEIPAGKFIIGEGNGQHELTLPTFYISRFPVTVAQFRAAGIEPQYKDAFADPDNHPVRYLTWYRAVDYCNWLDKTLRNSDQTPPALAEKLRQGWKITLPSEAEWEKAARGTNGQIYPWQGDEIEPTLANYDRTGIGSTSTVGCFPAGASPYGVEEMSGNIWEWTRSRYLDYPYPSDKKGIQERGNLQKDDRKSRVLRGGAFRDDGSSVRCAFRLNFNPYFGYNGVGFRVVACPFTSGL